MRNRFLCIGAIAFLAGAMAIAQNNSQDNTDTQSGSTATTPEGTAQTKSGSDIPGAKEGQTEKGSDKQANPDESRPGAMGAPYTPNTGTAPQGETPATGSQTEQKGTTDENNTRPGSSPTAQPDNNDQSHDQSMNNNGTGNPPKSMSSDTSKHTPDYEKPIDQNQDKNAPNNDSGDTNMK